METDLESLAAEVLSTVPSRRGKHFPFREVATVDAPADPWKTGVPDRDTQVPWPGGDVSREEFLRNTDTNAFVVVRDGLITHEWYADGYDAEQRLSSWSVAKSIVSLLLGRAVEDGLLSLDDRLVDLLPEYRTGDEFDTVTVHHLVNMASGIDVPEEPESTELNVGTVGLYLTKDAPDFLLRFRTLFATPGTAGSYRSADTAYLGLILNRVTGRALADLASEWLWQPIGAEAAAQWSLDQPDGFEKAFCCFNATARDFARVGWAVASRQSVGGRRLVSDAWMTKIATASPLPVEDLPYSTHWWQVEREGDEGDFSAIGIHGQFIYVNPKRRVTIVKLSDYGVEQDEWETLFAMRHLAINAAG